MVWLHGASAGESVSALTLASNLEARCAGGFHFVITCGTVGGITVRAALTPDPNLKSSLFILTPTHTSQVLKKRASALPDPVQSAITCLQVTPLTPHSGLQRETMAKSKPFPDTFKRSKLRWT